MLTVHKDGLPRVEEKDGYKIIRVGKGLFNFDGYLNKTGKLIFAISSAFYILKNRNFSILKFIGVGHIVYLLF